MSTLTGVSRNITDSNEIKSSKSEFMDSINDREQSNNKSPKKSIRRVRDMDNSTDINHIADFKLDMNKNSDDILK